MSVPFLRLDALHRQLVDDVLSDWRDIITRSAFIGGQLVEQFEGEWAAYCGVEHALGVANGTDALTLILRALDIGPGDEVIVPANTFVATAEAVVASGARPRFVDVDDSTLLLDADHVRAAIGPATAAVVVVHLHGTMPEMSSLSEVCRRAGIALIEDAAQAHGATHQQRRAGSWGVAAGFSFYPGKNLGAFGDAGAITTDDASVARRIRSLRDHGRTAHNKHLHAECGTNSRLDTLQAAVLLRKLPLLDDWNRCRAAAAAAYRAQLPPDAFVPVTPAATEPVHHVMAVEIPQRDVVLCELGRRGIEAGVHYPVPCHRQAAFVGFADGPLPVVERSAGRLISLPLHPLIEPDEVGRVCAVLGELLDGESRSRPRPAPLSIGGEGDQEIAS